MFSELLQRGPLDVFAEYANYEFECFKTHTKKIEELLQKEVKGLTDEIDAKVRSAFSEQSAEAEAERYAEQYWLLSEKLPQIQRKGDLMALFALFESELDQVCRNLENNSNMKLGLKDLANKGVDRAKVYLERVAQIRFPSDGPLWREIKQIQSVRNVFAHSDGVIRGEAKNSAATLEYVKQSPYLNVCRENIVFIDNGFIAHCLDIFAAFFFEIARINRDQGGSSQGLQG